MNKKKVLLAPSFRTIEEIFHPDDLKRLHDCCEVLWGSDEPISMGEFESVKKDVWAIISPRWRYGDVKDIPNLKAFMEVGVGCSTRVSSRIRSQLNSRITC